MGNRIALLYKHSTAPPHIQEPVVLGRGGGHSYFYCQTVLRSVVPTGTLGHDNTTSETIATLDQPLKWKITGTESYFWKCRWCDHCPLQGKCSPQSSSPGKVSPKSPRPHRRILQHCHSNAPLWNKQVRVPVTTIYSVKGSWCSWR